MTPDLSYEKHAPMLRRFAQKVLRRFRAAGGRGLTLEDLTQEMAVAWCLARDAWKPEFNVPFSAFLVRGARNQVNRYLEKEIGRDHEEVDLLDRPTSEDGTTVHEVMPDRAPLPDQILIEDDLWDEAMAHAEPLTRQFLTLLRNPPPALVAVVEAGRTRAAYGRDRGINTFAPASVNAALIFDLMGIEGGHKRSAIYADIRRVTEKVNQS